MIEFGRRLRQFTERRRTVRRRIFGLLGLFVAVWVALGLFIRDADLESYALQQIGVDAIVSHGSFAVGQSTNARLQPAGDVFRYNGRLFAAKQPGQFAFGAMAYTVVRASGVNYDNNYLVAARWVTWLSATSFAAAAVVALYFLLHFLWALPAGAALAAASALGFGTPLFAYSGVAHHDVIAGSLAFVAFTALEAARLGRLSPRWGSMPWVLTGICSGLALFTSMLPALIVLAILLGALVLAVSRSSRYAVVLLVSFTLGLLPLAFYNWHYFGAPWIQANVAGNFTDTFFRPSFPLLRDHIWTYLGWGTLSLPAFSPLGFIGLLALPVLGIMPALRFPMRVALVAVIAHFTYICSIESVGGCEFGPRYLLPLLPFFFLAPALLWASAPHRSSLRIRGRTFSMHVPISVLLGIAWLASVGIGLLGARVGTMNCDLGSAPFSFIADRP
jgi:hypothetical protein